MEWIRQEGIEGPMSEGFENIEICPFSTNPFAGLVFPFPTDPNCIKLERHRWAVSAGSHTQMKAG